MRGPEIIIRRLSEITLLRAGDDFCNLSLIRIFKMAAVIGRILASAVLNI